MFKLDIGDVYWTDFHEHHINVKAENGQSRIIHV